MNTLLLKITSGLLTVLFIIFLVSFAETIINIDVARTMIGTKASDVEVEALRHELGLDVPFYKKLLKRVSGILRGDFGVSYQYNIHVLGLIKDALRNTLALLVPVFLVSFPLGMMIGAVVAHKKSHLLNSLFTVFTSLSMLPSLVIATLVVYGLGYLLRMFYPSFLTATVVAAFVPTFTTALSSYEQYSEALRSEYVRAARSFGFPETKIVAFYALKPSLIAIVANLTNVALYVFSATVFVEMTFRLPGLGMLLLTATERFDYPVITGTCLIIGVFFILINLFSEGLFYALSPYKSK
jgi:ABC-type dipeptide/oligopeptide/nickel transport system permease component